MKELSRQKVKAYFHGFCASCACLVALTLSGCFHRNSVPEVTDTKNILIDGRRVTAREFLDRFCLNNATDSTCSAVMIQVQIDTLKRKPNVNW